MKKDRWLKMVFSRGQCCRQHNNVFSLLQTNVAHQCNFSLKKKKKKTSRFQWNVENTVTPAFFVLVFLMIPRAPPLPQNDTKWSFWWKLSYSREVEELWIKKTNSHLLFVYNIIYLFLFITVHLLQMLIHILCVCLFIYYVFYLFTYFYW